ncbi:DUF2934 domain-containing protein [Bradyrhizobium sp. CCGUVB1N3]|uniref:DUF2934 domain-containing protein n=1 Tax=Bradyrhizobium sp. CCGUVB1N3 TaxID=2949629 RepID=UPI0020B1AB0C|nr:DUF2934 domain-containing protein [Bradyrhizobium sp. CCGUVB1N3]MCP3471746.1 DUF2934 domain-containing protein [Bradyrhizobium sp. CCGUVB1N3]
MLFTFELWEQAGKPEGREDEFWHQAQRELQDAEGREDLNKGADMRLRVPLGGLTQARRLTASELISP